MAVNLGRHHYSTHCSKVPNVLCICFTYLYRDEESGVNLSQGTWITWQVGAFWPPAWMDNETLRATSSPGIISCCFKEGW